ncbi:MAG TPA: AAA family ATPase [Candidatus Dormibacteraeota bacterium]|jgi:CO dehydrogenase maturation factor
MRIAFVGKGGSGKTTLAALFARWLAATGAPVLAIDADINQHLGTALGLSPREAEALPSLVEHLPALKEHLRGANPRIRSAESMVKTTPPGTGSRLLTLVETGPVLEAAEREVGGVRLLVTGPFAEDDLGVACYHSKVGAAELLLNHLVDRRDEYVVVDMTAGADSFASGMFTRFDLTVLVVEPTARSVAVHRQYLGYSRGFGVSIAAAGNKVRTDDDRSYLETELGAPPAAVFVDSEYVRAMEKGQFLPLRRLEPENELGLRRLRGVLDGQRKDWDRFHRQTVEFHIRNARAWANAAVGEDLTAQVDPEFVLSVKE